MKKTILLIVILFLFGTVVSASEQQRMLSSGIKSSSCFIKTSAGRIYGVSMVATANAGWACIFDGVGGTQLVELREATQYNSQSITFPEGLNAYTNIRLQIKDASAIIYYR